jgi:cytochrome P450
MAELTTEPVRLPPGPRLPSLVQGLVFVAARNKAANALHRRYGPSYTLHLPVLGTVVVISESALVKNLFTTSTDLVRGASTLGAAFGPGSTFSLDGAAHRARRRLLAPAFHHARIQGFEEIIEEEVMREIAHWPEGQEFATLPSMMRITLNAILRMVFGAEGTALKELRELVPALVALGSRMAVMPSVVRRDWGRWSPGGRLQHYRRRYDGIITALLTTAIADPAIDERTDMLALMLRSRDADGAGISKDHIADELLGFLAAGHETTATTLAWALERLRRHPSVLSRLTEETDSGRSTLRQATIWEVQRVRPAVETTVRHTSRRIRLGEWVIPENHALMVNIAIAHASQEFFPLPHAFLPERFLDRTPDNYTLIPFGGGVRRCPGAAFAHMEIDVTLRTLLREFDFVATSAPGERYRSRGVTNAPADGGRVVVHRRARPATALDPHSRPHRAESVR